MAGDYELKLTPHLKEWGSRDKDRSDGIGAGEAAGMSDEGLVKLLNDAKEDIGPNGRDDFFRTLPIDRVAQLIAESFAGRLPRIHSDYLRNLTRGHSSHLAALVDEVLADPLVQGGLSREKLADRIIMLLDTADDRDHLFRLLSETNEGYVASRTSLPVDETEPGDRNFDRLLERAELEGLSNSELVRIFVGSVGLGTAEGSTLAYHHLFSTLPEEVQLGVIGAVMVATEDGFIRVFLHNRFMADPEGFYRLVEWTTHEPSEGMKRLGEMMIAALGEGPRKKFVEIDRRESEGRLEPLYREGTDSPSDVPTPNDLEASPPTSSAFEQSTLPRATLDNFQETIIEESRQLPVLVFVGVGWCGFCNRSTPYVEELQRKYEGRLSVVLLDAVRQPILKDSFSRGRYPTFAVVKGGDIIGVVEGFGGPAEIEELIRKGLPQEI